jgi:hypothetical protein
MESLITDFFKSWEKEIAAYQEVMICLRDQKEALIEWNIKKFQKISQQTAIYITRAHQLTNMRNDLMESIFVMKEISTTENSLQTISEIFSDEEEEYIEKSEILFQSFVTALRTIDKLSAENKDLIKAGLEIVGTNLELIADLSEKDRVYSRVGMIPQRKNSILLNTRI